MPIFVAALLGGLVQVAGSLVGRVLLALGIGYVTYSGLDTAMTVFSTKFFQAANTLPSAVIGVMGVLKVGTSFSIVLAAIGARLVLNGLTSGKITRMVTK